ncbi:glycosyltransferase family 4 protein [Conexibacter woesei]|uniref:Glycosyl transferase group 1 n=1 Tax=Conexibacter woesei (strain DSM 14684 / CCUG 47730 / CIP 108061 / JCM 11494 / NBRC 100937 / ID131577) TaxID=469383 RepID=D3FED8_CONWI|nr:glycosyltransferase family 4 protein [Conexibacter woesei]ADB53630.1 glycosyl transferase group 1 [Conexibacter woesei DSM 14684]
MASTDQPSTPARVLLLHNRYRAAGGEERVVDQQETLLREHGHAVARLERDSSETGAAQAARGLLRGGLDERAVAEAVRAHRADVVHAHNVHPLLGWRALAAAREAGARVVLHLHNYRLVCATAMAYRDGAPCTRCHGRDTRPGVRLRCRGSLPEAVVYGAGIARQQPRLLAHADACVVVSRAQLATLVQLGAAPPGAVVLPNAVERIAADSAAVDGTYALVAGRLVEEKGYDVAVRAARAAGVPLRIAGEGPAEPALRALAAGGDVRFLGRLPGPELAAQRRGAAVMLAPSRAQDPSPMSVVEALADGVPVLASDRGGLPELVGSAATLPVDDEPAWTAALAALWTDPRLRAARAADGLARARAEHAPEVYYERLTEVYARVLA